MVLYAQMKLPLYAQQMLSSVLRQRLSVLLLQVPVLLVSPLALAPTVNVLQR